MEHARLGHTATRMDDGRVLVVGGQSVKSAEIYDPGTGRWFAAGELKHWRSGHTTTLLNHGRLLATGGSSRNPSFLGRLFDTDTKTTDRTEFYRPGSPPPP